MKRGDHVVSRVGKHGIVEKVECRKTLNDGTPMAKVVWESGSSAWIAQTHLKVEDAERDAGWEAIYERQTGEVKA